MDYAKRIKELRKKSHLTQDKLARMMGLETPNFLSQIETGKKRVGLSVITKFCNAIGMELSDFFREAPGQMDTANSIPVIDISDARVDSSYDSEYHPLGKGKCSIKRPQDVNDKYAYGAIVRGESMYPAIEDNDLLIASPSQPFKSNDIVIVGLANQDVLVRKIRASDDLMVLECLNPSVEPQFVKPKDIRFAHPVLWVRYKSPIALLTDCL